MIGFADRPLDELRIGVVGLGQRGADALHTLAKLPGVRIAAVCDFFPERVALQQAWLKENRLPEARSYSGPDGWKALCESGLDLVYNVTPWALHVPVAVYAMEHGKHVATEVPCAFTVEDCWRLVETSERTRRHCVPLENCCYGEVELMTLEMIRAGLFGELKHAECAYFHDLRKWCYDGLVLGETAYGKTGYFEHWRLKWNEEHVGNQYPTHGFGPVCWYFGVNRGDRLDYLVSLESQPCGFADYAREKLPGTDLAALRPAMGDMNTTLVKLASGRSVMIQHDVASPRPYSRINLVSGTRGIVADYPLRMAFADAPGEPAHKWFTTARTKRWAKKYRHELWRTEGEQARLVGGHGGMDFLMMLRLCENLRLGRPVDMDVYDLAAWCSICELSERSVRSRSQPVDIPDFTRGAGLKPRALTL